MLSRYQIKRGASVGSLPREVREGIRQDCRKHTRHVLRPSAEVVEAFLADPKSVNWTRFAKEYRATLAKRFREDSGAFDALAESAREQNVFIGCSCPTA